MSRIQILSILLFVSLNSSAWGPEGHRMVVEGAYWMLSPEKQKKLIAILESEIVSDEPLSLYSASIWMDVMRESGRFKETYPWHFINAESDANNNNTVDQILISIKTLQKEKVKDYDFKFRILVLLHLLGDLHQPLHCGYKDDYGGNTYLVNCLVCPGNTLTDLHSVWDTAFIDYFRMTRTSIDPKVKQFMETDGGGFSKKEVNEWKNESFRIVMNKACYPNPKEITPKYLEKYRTIVEWQLAKATVRLYRILDAVL